MNLLSPTQLNQTLPLANTDFSNLAEALEYAARGESGYNFYDGRGRLEYVLSYATLELQAKILARKLVALGCPRGSVVGIIAETDPLFHRFFFACQYAGLIPVALPAGVQLGAHNVYIEQIARMLKGCNAKIAVAPDTHTTFLAEASESLDLVMSGSGSDFDALPEDSNIQLKPFSGDEPAYLQFTSGSTQFPRGVEISQATVMANLKDIAIHGLKLERTDRFVSWLPLYHDMGLVGFVLVPLNSQLSADYMSPRTFAMRPRLWLKILSDNRGTISSSPTFGYALCAKRLRPSDTERYDLSSWRAACVGAERVNHETMDQFANALRDTGFNKNAFVACYGMAECVLAISFSPLNQGLSVDWVDKFQLGTSGKAVPALDNAAPYVDCGEILPSFEYLVRDDDGNDLGDRQCGRICIKGPAVMSGYYQNKAATDEVLSEDGWLDTGDIGYLIGSHIVITARRKDVIIVNGINIWPQDLEMLAERTEGVRLGGVSAFGTVDENQLEHAVLVVETRDKDQSRRNHLIEQLAQALSQSFGLKVHIELTLPGTLRRTSSGKLSRSQTRDAFLKRSSIANLIEQQIPNGNERAHA
ncbi:MAG: fatty acyl-AMP ligase [Pseudomonadales bacterium]|nr:fatty acyl-AMP ligase [Pseudomonadales bacterium]